MSKLFLFIPLIPFIFSFHPDTRKTEEYNFFSNKNLVIGESLTYVVSYSFIKLGEIKIFVRGKKEIKGKTYYNTIAYMDSYSGIPFVNLHMIYESTLTPDYYSNYFRGIVKKKEYTTFTEYTFKYDSSLVRIKKGKINPYKLWTDSTTTAKKEYQDGLSILYFARMNSGVNKTVDLPCFVNEKKELTVINFHDAVSGVKINALDYDVACVRLDGDMKFVSVFGLTGYFEGWFSDDEASIPIVAKLKVIIGNVKVELKSWKRRGWTPPKFKND